MYLGMLSITLCIGTIDANKNKKQKQQHVLPIPVVKGNQDAYHKDILRALGYAFFCYTDSEMFYEPKELPLLHKLCISFKRWENGLNGYKREIDYMLRCACIPLGELAKFYKFLEEALKEEFMLRKRAFDLERVQSMRRTVSLVVPTEQQQCVIEFYDMMDKFIENDTYKVVEEAVAEYIKKKPGVTFIMMDNFKKDKARALESKNLKALIEIFYTADLCRQATAELDDDKVIYSLSEIIPDIFSVLSDLKAASLKEANDEIRQGRNELIKTKETFQQNKEHAAHQRLLFHKEYLAMVQGMHRESGRPFKLLGTDALRIVEYLSPEASSSSS